MACRRACVGFGFGVGVGAGEFAGLDLEGVQAHGLDVWLLAGGEGVVDDRLVGEDDGDEFAVVGDLVESAHRVDVERRGAAGRWLGLIGAVLRGCRCGVFALAGEAVADAADGLDEGFGAGGLQLLAQASGVAVDRAPTGDVVAPDGLGELLAGVGDVGLASEGL